MPGPLTRLRYWLLARRRARQRRDLRTLLMLARARLDGAHLVLAKVLHARDAERDRLVRELEEALRRQVALEEALLDLQAREIPPAP